MKKSLGVLSGLVPLIALFALPAAAFADDSGPSRSRNDCGDLKEVPAATECHSPRKCGGGGSNSWSFKYKFIEIGIGGDFKNEDGDGDPDKCCRRLITTPDFEKPIYPGDYKLRYLGSIPGLIETGNCKRNKALGFLWTTSWNCEYGNAKWFGLYDQWIRVGLCDENEDPELQIVD